MQYLLIFVMFAMAMITAAHACFKEGEKRGEVVVNYILGLMSIVFGIGFSMTVTLLLTGEAKNMHLLILLVVVPAFCGIALGDWVREFEPSRLLPRKARTRHQSKC